MLIAAVFTSLEKTIMLQKQAEIFMVLMGKNLKRKKKTARESLKDLEKVSLV